MPGGGLETPEDGRVRVWMCRHGPLWWPGISFRTYSCLSPSIPGIDFGSTTTLTKCYERWKNEWMKECHNNVTVDFNRFHWNIFRGRRFCGAPLHSHLCYVSALEWFCFLSRFQKVFYFLENARLIFFNPAFEAVSFLTLLSGSVILYSNSSVWVCVWLCVWVYVYVKAI